MTKLTSILALLLLATGCTVGPNYKRPSVDVPGGYRGVAPSTADADSNSGSGKQQGVQPGVGSAQNPGANQSLADQKWWEVFQDKQLQELIRTALQNNYDVNIAATRILQAQ